MWIIRRIERLGRVAQLIGETLALLLRGRIDRRETLNHMVNLGVDSLPLVLVVSGFTGMVFSFQVSQEFSRFGLTSLIGQLMGMAVIRELGPVLAGVAIAGRVGSAIAAELGSMKVTDQVDALRSLATDPVEYLVVPRVVACAVMVPVLTVFSNVIAMLGGYFIAVYGFRVLPVVFWEGATVFVGVRDLVGSLIKGLVFGVLVAVIGSDCGLNTEQGAQGVGQATFSAVVLGLTTVFIANYFLSLLWFR